MNFTKEQKDAIFKTGQNIIVSAGAGSGKTAVLTERVIEKLKNKIKINELLILTFTNAAALEMKERIRKKISKYPELQDNLDYLESAYITTFDSYTLSLVKKYNDILNVSPNLQIIEGSIINVLKNRFMEEVFTELYTIEDQEFLKFLDIYTIKNDKEIKKTLLNIYEKLSLVSDLDSFLDNYLENYLTKEKEEVYLKEYLDILKRNLEEIETNLYYIESSDYASYYEELSMSLEKLLKSQTYEEIKENVNLTLPRRPHSSEDIKIYKDNIDTLIKGIKKELRFKDTKEIYTTLESTKDSLKVIIKIIKEFKNKLDNYKKENDLYEFIDISKMAINLLKNNPLVLEEVKNSFKEICVDEYQDTNDLQEEFIKLIENNNVYMVGDIKQSIYGFRNANPQIFKEKYDAYKENLGGLKIDLLQNFRSRKEVIEGINAIFSLIMDDDIGGANYHDAHQMNFGNALYEEFQKEDNNLEIRSYEEDREFKNNEIEAFYIGKDILDKINSNYEVIDKETNRLRKAEYQDFCIIMDRGTDFPLYKKIFEYLNIPLEIYEDEVLTKEIDLNIIYNLLNLVLKVKDNNLDAEFKYSFMSIGRSFLCDYSDDYLFEIWHHDSFLETDLYTKIKEISKQNNITCYELIKLLITEFAIYENIIHIGNAKEHIKRINNILDMAKNLSNMGYTPLNFKTFLKDILDTKYEIKFKGSKSSENAVKIMNIHKSKGLEFSICYFSGFAKNFNIADVKERFIFDKDYGLIIPFYKEGLDSTILYPLFKNKYLLENISEKIRLLYVALTRAKEKMIIVVPLNAENYSKGVVDYNIRKKYNSFLSILNSISLNLKTYYHHINLEELALTKNYLFDKNKSLDKLKSSEIITYKEIQVANKVKNKDRASKKEEGIRSLEEIEKMQIGEEYHKALEMLDFRNVSKDNKYYENIKYLKENLNITNKTKIYKEYEFAYTKDNVFYEGIMDLLLVEDDKITLVDYKLKNIDDEAYLKQLKVYYDYLKTLFKKDIYVYLYSILDNKLTEKKLLETV